METSTTHSSVLATLMRQMLPLFPPSLHEQLEREVPALSLGAMRLGLEVLDAEREGVRFSAAVERAAVFPLIGRVYFGVLNLLQWQVPPPVREALQHVLRRALEGRCDSLRKLTFALAQRKGDADAALCRFILWTAVRLNVLILTWHQPSLEVTGVLDKMEDRGEAVLRTLLEAQEFHEPDCRPLHLLGAQVLKEAFDAAAPLLAGAMTEIEVDLAEALKKVRGLRCRGVQPRALHWRSRVAADLRPVSQHHYASLNAIEQRRSRIRKSLDALETAHDRLIDIVLAAEGDHS
jgi:hypothetical protein